MLVCYVSSGCPMYGFRKLIFFTAMHGAYWAVCNRRHPQVGSQIAHFCSNPWCSVHGIEVNRALNFDHQHFTWTLTLDGVLENGCQHKHTHGHECWPRPERIIIVSLHWGDQP